MAETLNRFGVKTYYLYLEKLRPGHDSTLFHYGNRSETWDLSDSFQNILGNSNKIIERLMAIKTTYGISHGLATGTTAYYLREAGIRYHYWSYGADLDYQCFPLVSLRANRMGLRALPNPHKMWMERRKTRGSINRADSVMISPYQREALNKICPDKRLFSLPHCLRAPEYQTLIQRKKENKKRICEQIDAQQFLFSSVRHAWVNHQKGMPDHKGNDVMLRSFAKYLMVTKDASTKLVLVEKGPDVRSSKSLSESLEIGKSVVWVDEMKREELDRYYQGAALCFGHFGTPVITYSVLEALANGTVSLSFSIENGHPVPCYKEDPPIFNTDSPEAMAEFMIQLLHDPNRFNDLSYQSWLWVKNNCSEERFVEAFLALFENTSVS